MPDPQQTFPPAQHPPASKHPTQVIIDWAHFAVHKLVYSTSYTRSFCVYFFDRSRITGSLQFTNGACCASLKKHSTTLNSTCISTSVCLELPSNIQVRGQQLWLHGIVCLLLPSKHPVKVFNGLWLTLVMSPWVSRMNYYPDWAAIWLCAGLLRVPQIVSRACLVNGVLYGKDKTLCLSSVAEQLSRASADGRYVTDAELCGL